MEARGKSLTTVVQLCGGIPHSASSHSGVALNSSVLALLQMPRKAARNSG